jgi:hypothetical protein
MYRCQEVARIPSHSTGVQAEYDQMVGNDDCQKMAIVRIAARRVCLRWQTAVTICVARLHRSPLRMREEIMNRRTIALDHRGSPIARGRQQVRSRSHDADEASDQIDESLEETFPASDPPSRTFLIRIGAPAPERRLLIPLAATGRKEVSTSKRR